MLTVKVGESLEASIIQCGVRKSCSLVIRRSELGSPEMSMSMDPPSGLAHSSSFQDSSGSGSGASHSQPHSSEDPAATLMTSHQMSVNAQGSASGPIPPPFRSVPQYRQYPTPNSMPPVLPSSGNLEF